MDNNSSLVQNNGNTPADVPVTAPSTKPHNNTKFVGPITGIIGFIAGIAGAFGIFKLTEKQPEKCPECNCPNQNVQVSSNDLDYSFLKMEEKEKNIIYSPLSIKNGLSLLSAGAAGDTKTEIEKVLDGNSITSYNNIPNVLSLANAVFIRDTFSDSVLPSYITTVQNELKSEVIYDTFSNTNAMDEWVKKRTFNLIDSMGIKVNSDTEMVLSNTLAIQMDWRHKFDSEDTFGDPFYKNDGTKIEATTMHQDTSMEDIKYYIDDSVKALSLPLDSASEDAELDFIAIMPEKNLGDYISNLSQIEINSIISNLILASTPKDGISISIPKFKFDYQLDFTADLETLGIKQAFDSEKANFTNMATKNLYVSDAIHKANIDFSEKGIKAAAVTAFAMTMGLAIDEPQPVIINIDRPFLFLIRDAKNGAIWFTGAVYEPNLWKDDAESHRY